MTSPKECPPPKKKSKTLRKGYGFNPFTNGKCLASMVYMASAYVNTTLKGLKNKRTSILS